MATIVINIPDNKATEVINAIAMKNNWTADNPLTKAQFAKKVVADFVKSQYTAYEAEQAGNTARNTSTATTDQVVID